MLGSLFVLLFLGHLLADYPFQTDHQAAHKADCNAVGWVANLTHCLSLGLEAEWTRRAPRFRSSVA
ncbi:hypothetical protein ACTOXX_12900 [Streptomyces rubiginosohelvolus]